jgi:L-ascorbate metabolism protein UlaG (beta-lactamase superfamily)
MTHGYCRLRRGRAHEKDSVTKAVRNLPCPDEAACTQDSTMEDDMIRTRREFLVTAAATGVVTLLPWDARAAGAPADVFESDAGAFTVHPIGHASFVMETPLGTIYSDPVGEPALYDDLPAPDLILVTHRHGDHYDAATLGALTAEGIDIITTPDVLEMMPDELKAMTKAIANGESAEWNGMTIDAIPAHNTTEDRMKFHPPGRDNGYVLGFDGFRIYISGDTEDVPEMRALENIDLAFVCMNLPFTMTAQAAASAVSEFKPKFVYPYHYRGRDGGTQDPQEFAGLVGDAAQVKLVDWYPDDASI